MGLEIKRQSRETSQGLVRRFGQKMQRSGILIRARKNRFRKREKSEGARKKEALRREELKIEYRKLEKLGAVLPDKRRRR